ncbi:MAG TPA: cytochrome c [Xanthobacteraceae bacterium]|jgi:cytochrome c
MSTGKHLAIVIALALGSGNALAADQPGLGKPLSEADLALWDISIGPDGKGLPSGSGTPAQGAAIFAQKCESCHGKDGQGGTNATLINAPGKSDRTMATYVPNATTIFDFTRRAMPWPQPKSLSNDEVYALTAFILAGNKIIGENDAMNAETLPKVQMPNRNGFVSRYPDKH